MADETERSQWTLETLREYLIALLQSNDIRYGQRFEASQSAINAAFLAQQTAMQTALTAQKLSVDTALAAADRAVTKAETATEKRFESVNEFRQTLSDLQSNFMPRGEATALIKAVDEKITGLQVDFEHKLEAQRLAFERAIETLNATIRAQEEARASAATAQIDGLSKRLNALELFQSNIEGRITMISAFVIVITILINVALHFLK